LLKSLCWCFRLCDFVISSPRWHRAAASVRNCGCRIIRLIGENHLDEPSLSLPLRCLPCLRINLKCHATAGVAHQFLHHLHILAVGHQKRRVRVGLYRTRHSAGDHAVRQPACCAAAGVRGDHGFRSRVRGLSESGPGRRCVGSNSDMLGWAHRCSECRIMQNEWGSRYGRLSLVPRGAELIAQVGTWPA
jgi:hypothetical protein